MKFEIDTTIDDDNNHIGTFQCSMSKRENDDCIELIIINTITGRTYLIPINESHWENGKSDDVSHNEKIGRYECSSLIYNESIYITTIDTCTGETWRRKYNQLVHHSYYELNGNPPDFTD